MTLTAASNNQIPGKSRHRPLLVEGVESGTRQGSDGLRLPTAVVLAQRDGRQKRQADAGAGLLAQVRDSGVHPVGFRSLHNLPVRFGQ